MVCYWIARAESVCTTLSLCAVKRWCVAFLLTNTVVEYHNVQFYSLD